MKALDSEQPPSRATLILERVRRIELTRTLNGNLIRTLAIRVGCQVKNQVGRDNA